MGILNIKFKEVVLYIVYSSSDPNNTSQSTCSFHVGPYHFTHCVPSPRLQVNLRQQSTVEVTLYDL